MGVMTAVLSGMSAARRNAASQSRPYGISCPRSFDAATRSTSAGGISIGRARSHRERPWPAPKTKGTLVVILSAGHNGSYGGGSSSSGSGSSGGSSGGSGGGNRSSGGSGSNGSCILSKHASVGKHGSLGVVCSDLHALTQILEELEHHCKDLLLHAVREGGFVVEVVQNGAAVIPLGDDRVAQHLGRVVAAAFFALE